MTKISSIYNFEYDFIIGSCSSFRMFFGEKLLVRLLEEEGVVELVRLVGVTGRRCERESRGGGDGVSEIGFQYKWLGMQ